MKEKNRYMLIVIGQLLMFWALTALSGVVALSQSADFYNNYLDGNTFLIEKNFTEAIEKYNAALQSYPVDYVYYNRGNAKLGMKDYKGAMADYNKTISLNSEYATAYHQRGLLHIIQGNKISGCEDLKQAKKIESTDDVKGAIKKHCK